MRRSISIAQVVEQHVSLKRAGRTLKGLCPFHSEKSPSFHVDEAKGFYHCFGCGAGGDVFKFAMQLEALTFPEAVRSLAQRAGLSVPERVAPSPADELRDRVLAINGAAQEIFRAELGAKGSGAGEALAYLSRRGISREVIESFGLGWAPDSWTFLGPKLRGRYEERELLASGLLAASDRGMAPYDRFRGRVTFPIRAVSERIVGFGGRIIGDGEPKYLNSPETPVYTKGRHLFGLDRARAGIRRTGRAVLVEGYVDAISLHAQGVDDAVAVLGTALTPEQARLLARFTRKVVLNFDGDEAGRRAARRSIPVLLAEGLDVRVMALPPGVDPDDHVRARGGEAYQAELDRAESFFDFLLAALAKDHDLSSPTGRIAALQEVLPLITAVEDPLLRSELTDAAAHGLRLRPELIKDEVRGQLSRGRRPDGLRAAASADAEVPHAESQLVAWMMASEQVRALVGESLGRDALAGLPRGAIFAAILDEPEGEFDVARVVERLEDEWMRAHVSALAIASQHAPLPALGLEPAVQELIEQVGISPKDAARRRKAEVDRLLVQARKDGDKQAELQLMAEAMELGKALHR